MYHRVSTSSCVDLLAVSILALVTSVLVNQTGGPAHTVSVVMNGAVLFVGPAAAAGVGRRTVGTRTLIALVGILVEIGIVNVIWTGGYDNDTLRSHLEASLFLALVTSLLSVVVVAGRGGVGRPTPPGSSGSA